MNSDDDRTQTHVVLSDGTKVSHYTIVSKIGAGGMGEVYLAEDTELDRKVALKFLPSHLCQDEDCRKRFKREAQAAAKLSHPNIIHVYEVSEFQGRPFFAMEHIEGRSLRDVKAEELDIDRIIGIAIQLCDGLDSAHAAGVTHRDIKPSNIIIDSSGRPRLLDFGLATVKGGEHLTKTGSTLGTVGYMSPEQIEGKPTDARSDLFSLGVVLYELVANKSPFRRDDETATLQAILHDAPEPLARYKSGVPDDLQRIVGKLLEKDPALRYQSASGVISDLKRLSPTRSSLVAVGKRRDRWNRYVVPSAVVILLAVVGVWYFGYRDKEPAISTTDDRIMLAVLPFENLGNPEDEYFADGMTEEIISRLAAVRTIGVISRTSVYKYKDEKKTIPEIAEELGVQYVLEGTVRWERSANTSRIRVTPQLIEVATDAHLWSDRYDRDLTCMFDIQSEIASQVVASLGMTLGHREKNQIERRPTENMAAYDAYMRAKEYSIYYPEEVKVRIKLFEQAIELDSGFVDAYGQLASDCIWMVRLGQDNDGSLLKTAENVLHIVGQSAPNNPIYLLAKCGYEYYINLNYDDALVYCQQSLDRMPNGVDALSAKSAILRRQGKWQESLVVRKQAVNLDPREQLWEYAGTLWCLRRLDSAMAALDRLLSLEPDDGFGTRDKAELLISWKGDFQAARDVMEKAIQTFGNVPGHNAQLAYIYISLGNYERALSLLAIPVLGQQVDMEYHYLLKGLAYGLAGDTIDSHLMYDSALACIDSYSAEGSPMAESTRLAERALALSGLGRHDEAVLIAERAAEILPVERDYVDGPNVLRQLARIYATAGMTDEALDVVEYLLSIPCALTTTDLEYRPEWIPLRDHPRFQALIKKYEKEHAI
jgi:TolB-like protein/tetratricopeptide (TPR) repeat protein/predicted Ser/Thr protein kinase